MRTLIATLCLALAPAAMAADKHVHRTIPLDANGTLTLSTHNGSITVTGTNESVADIDAVIEPGDMGYAEDVQKTEIRISGSGSRVRVESDYGAIGTHIGWLGFGTNRVRPPVHYTIRMPAGARLEIDAHNAKMRVSGLHGDVDVDSHNGAVDILDFSGGADIETHNGDVTMDYSRFTKASRVETHNGGLEIRLPADSRFHLDADGHHLGFDSDFPVALRRMRSSHYAGDINGGGPDLRFSTHNGSLRLIKD